MSHSRWLLGFVVVAGVAGLSIAGRLQGEEQGEEQPMPDTTVYELRTYTTLPGRLPALHARFRDHTLALFEKHGMTNMLYWTPTDGDAAGNTLIYVLKHNSREAADASWQAFRADPQWQAAKAASEADGAIVEKVESVFMTATDFSPLR